MAEQSLSIRLKVNDDGSVVLDKFSGKLKDVEKISKDINLIKWDSIVNLGRAMLQVTERLYDFGRGVASSLNDIDRQSKIIGVSTDQWQKWTYAAKMSDVETQGLMTSMKFLSQNIMESKTSGSEADRVFKALGITGGNLEETMYQLADVFARSEDGEKKIAIATKLLGKSAMEVIPYFNQGRQALKESGDEAERYGGIIGKDLIEAGNRADESFKKFETAIFSLKAAAIPLIEVFAKLLASINLIFEATRKVVKAWGDQEEIGIDLLTGLPIPKAAQRTEEGRFIGRIPMAPVIPKLKLPDILGKGAEEEKFLEKALEDDAKAWGIYADDQIATLAKLNEYKNEATKTDLERQAWAREKIIEGEQQAAQDKIEAWAFVYEVQNAEDMEFVENHKRAQERILEADEELNKTKIEAWDAVNQYYIEAEKRRSEMGEVFAERMGEAWNFNIKNIISDSENMGDAVRKVFYGMSDAFSSAISRMISDWMLFGNVTGTYKAGEGIIGKIGGLFGGGAAAADVAVSGEAFSAAAMESMVWLQHGADFWANKPMILGVGEGGERERVTVTPESKIGTTAVDRRPSTVIYNIDARGAQKGVSTEILRAIRESENRAVKRSVNTVADNKMRGGRFATTFER